MLFEGHACIIMHRLNIHLTRYTDCLPKCSQVGGGLSEGGIVAIESNMLGECIVIIMIESDS